MSTSPQGSASIIVASSAMELSSCGGAICPMARVGGNCACNVGGGGAVSMPRRSWFGRVAGTVVPGGTGTCRDAAALLESHLEGVIKVCACEECNEHASDWNAVAMLVERSTSKGTVDLIS